MRRSTRSLTHFIRSNHARLRPPSLRSGVAGESRFYIAKSIFLGLINEVVDVDIVKPNQVGSDIKKGGGINPTGLIFPLPSTPKPAPKPIAPLPKPKISLELEKAEIRTMEKDIKGLSGKGKTEPFKEIPKFKIPQSDISKKAEPPKGLPVIEPVIKPIFSEVKPKVPLPPRPASAPFPVPPEMSAKTDISSLLRLKKAKEEKEKKEAAGQGKKNVFKIAIISSAAVLILAAAGGGFYYWWKFLRTPVTHFQCREFQCLEVEGEGENKCLTNNDCLPPEPQIPLSLITTDKTETIEHSTDPGAVMQSSVLEKIIAKIQTGQVKGALLRILVKTTDENQVKEYVSLSQFSQLTGIVIPSSVSANFKNEYTLFAYTPDAEETELCQQAKITDEQCFGPRLGLAIEITDKEAVKQALFAWQTTMIDDLKPLILSQFTRTNGFQIDINARYQGKNIYYQNLPISPVALNYGFSGDILIIGTSKNCLYQALDRLGEK